MKILIITIILMLIYGYHDFIYADSAGKTAPSIQKTGQINGIMPDSKDRPLESILVRFKITAYCQYEKDLAECTDGMYNIKTGTFERIIDDQKMQELWQKIDWSTGKVVFTNMCETVLEQKKPKSIQILLRKLQDSILQKQTSDFKWNPASVLLSFMCKHSNKQTTNTTKNSPQQTWVYFYMETRPSQGLWREDKRACLDNGTKNREVSLQGRNSPSQKLYRGRQQARKSCSVSGSFGTSTDTQKDSPFNQGIYQSEKSTNSTPTIYRQVFKITAYCPNFCCCGEFADGITASGHKIQPGDKFVAAPSEIPFGTMIDIPGYGVVPVLDRGGRINKNRLDIYYDTHIEAINWGVKCLDIKTERIDDGITNNFNGS